MQYARIRGPVRRIPSSETPTGVSPRIERFPRGYRRRLPGFLKCIKNERYFDSRLLGRSSAFSLITRYILSESGRSASQTTKRVCEMSFLICSVRYVYLRPYALLKLIEDRRVFSSGGGVLCDYADGGICVCGNFLK